MLCIFSVEDYKDCLVPCKVPIARFFCKGKWGLHLIFFCLTCSASGTNSVLPQFVGAPSCAAGSCHGGAAAKRNEFTVWSQFDFHHERPYALLETRRSVNIAEILKIGDPTASERCTVCHAPMQTVPAGRLGPEVKVTDGVSCENCHAPAGNWLRPHTRPDWTTADRVCAGMRDLRNIYVRANTCVACHQSVALDLRRAGHPELIFELDGQSAAEPRHWQKSEDKPGPQIWLVGQAVALREISWQRSREKAADENLGNQKDALSWLLQSVSKITNNLPTFNSVDVQQWSDEFAKAAAHLVWTPDLTRRCLATLADTGQAFADKDASQAIQARRAERLVLGLDRLLDGSGKLSGNPPLNEALNRLFADVQSLPDFDPAQFAKHLSAFHTILADVSN